MSSTVLWLPRAIANRDALIDHIAKDNPRAAIEHDERIEQHADMLATHAQIGRDGRKSGTRELVVKDTPFIIVYRHKPKVKRVEILRVLHAAQAWPA